MQRTKLNEHEIAYRLAGDGSNPPVLLIHGFTGSHRNWAFTARALNEAGWRTLSPDNPGHGVSDAPDDAEHYTIHNTAALLHRLAEEQHCLPAVVIGHSLGGAIAEALTLAYPDAVQRLVLVGSAGGASGPDRRSNAEHLDALKRAYDDRGMKAVFDRQIELGLRTYPNNFSSLMLTLHRREFAKTSWNGFKYAGRALRTRTETLTGLKQWKKPTLIVHGEHEYPNLVKVADDLQQAMPHATRAIIAKASHNPQIESPQAFNRVLLEFLLKSN